MIWPLIKRLYLIIAHLSPSKTVIKTVKSLYIHIIPEELLKKYLITTEAQLPNWSFRIKPGMTESQKTNKTEVRW